MTDKDATTEAELRAIFGHMDPVPQLLDDAARAAFTWRTVDAELAELMRDSADGGGGWCTRARRPRAAAIELRVAAAGDRARGGRDRAARAPGSRASCSRRAAATVTVERPGEDGLTVQADELGRFVLDGLRAGVVRLHVALRGAQIAIPWTTI